MQKRGCLRRSSAFVRDFQHCYVTKLLRKKIIRLRVGIIESVSEITASSPCWRVSRRNSDENHEKKTKKKHESYPHSFSHSFAQDILLIKSMLFYNIVSDCFSLYQIGNEILSFSWFLENGTPYKSPIV